MSHPVIEPRDEQRSGSAGRAVAFVTSLVLFLLALYLMSLAFSVDEAWRAWVFAGGLASATLAFLLPMTIIPALEGE
jgi:hypothetical protein